MSRTRILAGAALATTALVLLPAPAATAHVHKITPLRCTPAPPNAGANQTNETPASGARGGPISGVIPIATGGSVPFEGGGFHALECPDSTE
jgi:hypothetical protein